MKIFANITSGKYNNSKTLPTQVELAKEFQVSRITIQRAINLLMLEGCIESNKRGGTHIKNSNSNILLDSDVAEHTGLTNKLSGLGKVTSSIISFSTRQAEDFECKKLDLPVNSEIYDIIRLRYFNNMPILLEYTVMPVNLIPGITEDILNQSIYSYIRNTLHYEIGEAFRRIHADKADCYDQKYLNCKQNDPILEIDQIAFLDKENIPFEYSQTRHRYDMGDFILFK
nr:GntR family transcriptional regulator [Lactobacillus mulieris]